MIKLDKVSKFYSKNGVVSSGMSKVSLEFKIGEFVAITGDSGSGKSTLLNVISGLDTYEEGEMYIEGVETSHYIQTDFEKYRRKYIGNIFQSFNLVNSYTVYQNIELRLLLNGYNSKDIKTIINEIIKKVGLSKYKNTKIAKLSGGQKQRVAIARTLAKNTPVIIADEPTGNLDSKSSKEILKLLSEISKDKLVIIVTHNYEQVEEYVTRKIKMNDGKVLEDKIIKKVETITDLKPYNFSNILFKEKFKLSFRNTFNIIPKFLLLLFIFLFITLCLSTQYSNYQKQKYEANSFGYNYHFDYPDDSRIIISKSSKEIFTEDNISNIKNMKYVESINKYDLNFDYSVYLNNDGVWLNSIIYDVSDLEDELTYGELPKEDNEIVVTCTDYIYNCNENLIGQELFLDNNYYLDAENMYKVVGIIMSENTNNYYSSNVYAKEDAVKYFFSLKLQNNFSNTTKYNEDTFFSVLVVDEDLTGNNVIVKDSLYSEGSSDIISFTYETTFEKNTYELNIIDTYSKLDFDVHIETEYIYVSQELYDEIYTNDIYQLSVFVSDTTKTDSLVKDLNDLGYNALALKDIMETSGISEGLLIINLFLTSILIIVLFFITYFVISIVLKSRNVYFATIRILGSTKKIAKNLLSLELIIVANLSYVLYLIIAFLNEINLINIGFISTNNMYMRLTDYICAYVVLIVMSYFISLKYSKKLFKNSAITTINEEI